MKRIWYDLRLHDGGVASGAGAPGSEGGAAASGAEAAPQAMTPMSQELQAAQAPPTEQAEAKPSERPSFRDLINGDYKEDYEQAIKQVVGRRLKQMEPMKQQLDQQQGIMSMLADRYGMDAADIGGIQKAMEADNSYWEEAAAEQGLTVQQFMQMKRLERENAQFQETLRRQEAERKAQAQMREWERQAVELKQFYPQFDLGQECQNKQFVSMLAHVPMKAAYEALHINEIMQGAVRQTAQAVEKGVTDTIRAKGSRPAENGLQTNPGVKIGVNPSKLTRKELKEIEKRVRAGERITFD